MNHYLLMSGIILGAVTTVVNRFICKIPDYLEYPLIFAFVGLILAGMLTSKG